jgi:uncharacterized protein YjiK
MTLLPLLRRLVPLLGLSLVTLVPARADPSYSFSTLAGSAGTVVNSIDATGTAAQFDTPRGIAMDSSGNFYVADSSNNTIRKITAAGVVTTLAGSAGSSGSTNGTGTAARFNEPFDVAVDSTGNVFVADTNSSVIRKITPAGVVTTFAGSGTRGSSDGIGTAASFYEPRAIAIDSAGTLYVADYFYHIIRKITSAGVVTTIAGTVGVEGYLDGTGTATKFKGVNGIAVDSSGNVFVADEGNAVIRKITSAGVVSTFVGTAGATGLTDGTGAAARLTAPRGLRTDSDGNLYFTDNRADTIRKATPAGVVTTLAGQATVAGSTDATGTSATFNGPSGLVLDSAGNLYVADSANDAIRKITPAGVVTTFAGMAGRSSSTDGTGAAAKFEDPYNVAVDSAGNVYVAESDAHCIRKITPAGVVTTLAGLAGTFGSADGTGPSARFNTPSGVAVDSAGNVYVADSSNHTIRTITPAGVVTTFAGSAGVGGSTDGTGSAARFNEPHGIAVDPSGNLYVSDTTLNTVRKITPAGVVTTLAGMSGTAGTADGTGTSAQFSQPFGIAVDSAGTVYLCDHGNHSVRKITAAGVVTTLAGLNGTLGYVDATGTTARLRFPSDVAVDAEGNVFVADTDNQCIRKITPAGVVTTVAGGSGVGSTDDVGTAAKFYNPKGVAVDSSGNLYVADRNNHTIRKGTAVTGPTSRLSNLAILTTLSSGSSVTVGMTMSGGSRNVLVRAAGPALTPLGVTGAMVDPRFSLYSDQTKLSESDNWVAAAVSATADSVGAFAFATGSKDAALVQSLNGSHTAIASGTAGGTVLVEAYDTGTAMLPRLINLSALNYVGTGSQIMIAGFTVSGTGKKNILVRAVGPTLTTLGVGSVLADPKLELYDGSTLIKSNDDWDPSLATTFSSVGAFALTPGSKDAAFTASVDAGIGHSYTAQVSGVNGGTGTAIVELYELP